MSVFSQSYENLTRLGTYFELSFGSILIKFDVNVSAILNDARALFINRYKTIKILFDKQRLGFR